MQAKRDLGDEREGAEGAAQQLREVVTGYVLDDLSTASCDGAVGQHEGHADDEIAQAAVPQAQSAGVVSADDSADGGMFWPKWIECDLLAVRG